MDENRLKKNLISIYFQEKLILIDLVNVITDTIIDITCSQTCSFYLFIISTGRMYSWFKLISSEASHKSQALQKFHDFPEFTCFDYQRRNDSKSYFSSARFLCLFGGCIIIQCGSLIASILTAYSYFSLL